MSKFKTKTEIINKKLGAMFLALHRKDTPLYAKLACGLCVYYVLSPVDLIPDFIPVLGALDDMAILPFLIWLSFKMVPDDIMDECLKQSAEIWQEGGERKMRYAIPIFIVWGLLAFWIITLIIKLFK